MLSNIKNWIHKDESTILTINLPKAKEKTNINVTMPNLKVLAIILISAFSIQVLSDVFLSPMLTQMSIDIDKPDMVSRANSGEDYAALWLVKYYKEEAERRLPALIEKGYPEAMSIKGYMLIRQGNELEGMAYIKKAADKGYKPAIDYINWKNR